MEIIFNYNYFYQSAEFFVSIIENNKKIISQR